MEQAVRILYIRAEELLSTAAEDDTEKTLKTRRGSKKWLVGPLSPNSMHTAKIQQRNNKKKKKKRVFWNHKDLGPHKSQWLDLLARARCR